MFQTQNLKGKFVENAKEQATDAVARKYEFEIFFYSRFVLKWCAAVRNACFSAGNLP
jgi:hypothetical protein